MTTTWHWVIANYPWILLVLGYAITNVLNHLSGHPRVETGLRVALDVISWIQRRGSAGIVKLPGQRSVAVTEVPAGPMGPPAAMLLVLAGIAGILVAPRVARGDVTSGPTIPLVRVDLGRAAPSPAVLAAGAGYQVSYGALPRVINGHSWDLLQVGVAGFVRHDAGATLISVAGILCSLNNLICGGAGYDVYGSTGHRYPFLLVSFGFDLGTTAPSPVPSSLPVGAPPPPYVPAGNTVVLP